MATLSKIAIENIAEKMTEKSKQYKNELFKKYSDLVAHIYQAQIPDEIKEIFKTHPEYIETTSHICLDGHGFNRELVDVGKQLPSKSHYAAYVNLTAPIADKIIKAKRKWEKARDDYKQLYQETESALMALKTNKNIRENLPEAIPYLPPPMSNSLVVNFESLQNRLNTQPEIKDIITN